MVEHSFVDFEQKAEVYTVYITDEKQTTSGSGVLYYGGSGDFFYVFTCAHVIEEMENIVLKLLLPGSGDGEYDIYEITVHSSQAAYSPLDKIDENGNHSHDVAVIRVYRDKRLILEKTDYFISEAGRRDAVFIQGYPGGQKKEESLLGVLDVSHGIALHNISQSKFQLRIEDLFADQSQRVFETKGFSGAGVWKADEDTMCLSVIFESASRENAYRGKYYAARVSIIQSIMKNHFEIQLESKIAGIPESDVADINDDICCNGTVHVSGNVDVNDLWLQKKTEKVRAFIDELQMQSAIDLAVDILKNDKFKECLSGKKKLLLQHLLYCYEICYLDEEYHKTEQQMREYGFIQEHDELRWMTSQFGKRNFEEVIAYLQKYLDDHTGEENSKYVIAQMFLTLSKAYTEDLPAEKTVRKFLDDRESLLAAIEDREVESLMYQMLGYVYGEHYKQYGKSVRCLNRAYRLGNDKVVLETLAEAYYFLALKNAVRDDGTVNVDRIDRGSLYKARECYLVIHCRADKLFLSGLIRRAGVVLYNTFFFLMDEYRVVAFYPLLRKYLPENLTQQDLRDIELKQAKIICRSGYINLEEFPSLNDKDKRCLAIMAQAENCLHFTDLYASRRQLNPLFIEQTLKDIISLAEDSIGEIDEKDSVAVRCLLMNLYGRGITLFSWNAVDEIRRHLSLL